MAMILWPPAREEVVMSEKVACSGCGKLMPIEYRRCNRCMDRLRKVGDWFLIQRLGVERDRRVTKHLEAIRAAPTSTSDLPGDKKA